MLRHVLGRCLEAGAASNALAAFGVRAICPLQDRVCNAAEAQSRRAELVPRLCPVFCVRLPRLGWTSQELGTHWDTLKMGQPAQKEPRALARALQCLWQVLAR